MAEKPNHNHYSDKGGHLRRSFVAKTLNNASKQDLIPCKDIIAFCGRRFAKRMPSDGKK